MSATVKDAKGNTLGAGINVNFSTNLGSLSAASATTNSSGVATVTIRGTVSGVAAITASAVGGSANTNVGLLPDWSTARIVSLTASPTSIPTNSTTPSAIIATIRDANNNNVGAGFSVSFARTAGSLSASSALTSTNGQATVNLRATTVGSGSGTVTASVPLNSANVVVGFYADPASLRVTNLTASPSTITADGMETSTLTATVRDANGNNPGVGSTVSWGTSLGALAATSSTTDANGQATMTLKGSTAGSATVTASAVAGSANATVTLTPGAPTITSLSATESTSYVNYDSVASRLSWSGTGLTGATTYTVTVVDANSAYQQYFDGPSSFTPTAGSSSWWLNTLGQQNQASQQSIPTPYSRIARATLQACNGGACSTASTTFTVNYDSSGSN
ncbi:Ig-like domain-containing protein [Pseudomonas corrugata]|nr:Ig-like domain-containing protein [Pseudomonas corrugata]